MSKYERYDLKSGKERRWKIHPIWRGIGCILLVIVLVGSYLGAIQLVQANITQGWFPVPRELAGGVNLPFHLGRIYFMHVLVFIALLVVLFGLITAAYGAIYSLFGPRRYNPPDSPPVAKYRKPRKPKWDEK